MTVVKPAGIELSSPGRVQGFRAVVGHRCVEWREGYAVFELELLEHHFNPGGIVHGGIFLTILDSALAHACTYCPVAGNKRRAVTISLTTSFLAPGKGGLIRAVGRQEAAADRIATCSGEVLDAEGRLLAAAQGSFRYLPGGENLEGVPLAPAK